MKIKELKEMIANMPDDADLSFQMQSGCCGEFEEMEISYTDIYEPHRDWQGSLLFRFHALPGYKSCIQAGGTIRADKEYWERISGKKETP